MIAVAFQFVMWLIGFLFPKKSDAENLGQQEQQNADAQTYIKKEEQARIAGSLVRDDPRSVYNDPDNRSR